MPAVGGPSSACDDSAALIKSSGASASIFKSACFIVRPSGFFFLHSETVFYAQLLVNPSPSQSERSGGDAWEATRPEQYSRRPAWRRHDARTWETDALLVGRVKLTFEPNDKGAPITGC